MPVTLAACIGVCIPPEALLLVAPRLLLVSCRRIGDVIQQWHHEQPFRAILPRRQETSRWQALDCWLSNVQSTVDDSRLSTEQILRWTGGRSGASGAAQVWCSASGCTLVYSLGQIVRVGAEVFQVSLRLLLRTCSAREVQDITVRLQKVVQYNSFRSFYCLLAVCL